MNKSDNPLDNLFRDQLKDQEIQPEPHVWESINTAINKKSRNVWPILVPVILILAAFAIYFIASNNPTPQSQEPVSGIEQTDPAASLDKDGQATPISPVDKQEIDQEANQELALSEDRSASVHDGNEQEQPDINSNNNTTQNELRTQSKNSAPDIDRTSSSASEKLAENINTGKTPPSANETVGTSEPNTSGKTETLIENETSPENKASVLSDINNSDTKGPGSVNSWAIMESLELLDTKDEGFQRFSVDHFKDAENAQRKVLSTTDLCALMYPKTNECPTFKDLNRRFQLDVYAIGGKKFSNLSTNDNVGSVNAYLNKRRNSETPLWNVGMGIRLANQWTNGVSVRGGIQISKGQIRLNYQDESQRRTVVNVVVDTIVDDNGNTTVVWDTLSIVETNIIPVEEFNSFTQLDVPVTVGYTFLGRNYDIELNGGVMFNLLFTKQGNIFDPENEISSIDPSDDGSIQAYKKKLGLSLITSFAINYHLTDQVSVFAEPQLRYFLQPVSQELYSLKESWFHMNLMLGTRYSF